MLRIAAGSAAVTPLWRASFGQCGGVFGWIGFDCKVVSLATRPIILSVTKCVCFLHVVGVCGVGLSRLGRGSATRHGSGRGLASFTTGTLSSACTCREAFASAHVETWRETCGEHSATGKYCSRDTSVEWKRGPAQGASNSHSFASVSVAGSPRVLARAHTSAWGRKTAVCIRQAMPSRVCVLGVSALSRHAK